MIGVLPKSLDINGEKYEIYSCYKIALLIFEMFEDNRISVNEKWKLAVDLLYKDEISSEHFAEACEKAKWFLDGGDMPKSEAMPQPVINWKQDESIIFPALNKVAGEEIRENNAIHWWTFLGFFNEIGEGLFSTVINIRIKIIKGNKLEKYEKIFYREHKQLIDIKRKLTPEEQAEINFVNSLFY